MSTATLASAFRRDSSANINTAATRPMEPPREWVAMIPAMHPADPNAATMRIGHLCPRPVVRNSRSGKAPTSAIASWFGSPITPSQRPRKPSTSSSSWIQLLNVPQPGTMAATAYMPSAMRSRRGVSMAFVTARKKRKCLTTSSAPNFESSGAMDHIGERTAAPV